MEIKSLLLGMAIPVLALLIIGGSYAAIASAGQTIYVPSGKVAMYFVMDSEQATELRDSICNNYRYDEASEETCTQFAQSKIIQFMKENVFKYRKQQYEEQFIESEEPVIE